MSEMLANHYFLVRNYNEATILYEQLNEEKKASKKIRKKLIICYVVTKQIDKALDEFVSLIEEDINYIIETDMNNEDCPCYEIIPDIKTNKIIFNQFEKEIALGILWLYCEIQNSLMHFKTYLSKNKENEKISIIVEKLSNALTNKLKGA